MIETAGTDYFEGLDTNADPATGLWKKGVPKGAEEFHYLAAAFHYVFNYEYAKRALPYPKELLDTCIKAYHGGVCMDFSKSVGWPDIDFTYMLARVQRRAGTDFAGRLAGIYQNLQTAETGFGQKTVLVREYNKLESTPVN